MAKELPFIPRKHIARDGKVWLWDMLTEGGPFRVEFTGILAREALARDPERYRFELPRGTKQGPLQDDADQRARDDAEAAAAEAPDPVYGRNTA